MDAASVGFGFTVGYIVGMAWMSICFVFGHWYVNKRPRR